MLQAFRDQRASSRSPLSRAACALRKSASRPLNGACPASRCALPVRQGTQAAGSSSGRDCRFALSSCSPGPKTNPSGPDGSSCSSCPAAASRRSRSGPVRQGRRLRSHATCPAYYRRPSRALIPSCRGRVCGRPRSTRRCSVSMAGWRMVQAGSHRQPLLSSQMIRSPSPATPRTP